jgi:N utilization substance protein B
MISRRNIRVKVMQTLYGMNLESEEAARAGANSQKVLQQHFDQTASLLLYLSWFLTEVARYAETDAHQRASKHLPTPEDLHINTKIAGNEVLWKMLESASFKTAVAKHRPQLILQRSKDENFELVRKVYNDLTASEAYKEYISSQARERADEKKILEFILNDLMLASEVFVSHVEENFSNWDDDGEMVVQLLVAELQKPGSLDYQDMLTPDKAQFAKELLQTVVEKSDYLQSLIKPKLKNWDPERIALLDMIIMKMGVAEFLYFQTIPPKVTINEYIDLAKEYSTAQSGQFVNGILDNIHKELVLEGKMNKVDYKKT